MHPNSAWGKIRTILGFLRAIIKAIWIKKALFQFRFMFQGGKKKSKKRKNRNVNMAKRTLNSNVFNLPIRRNGINSGTQLQ